MEDQVEQLNSIGEGKMREGILFVVENMGINVIYTLILIASSSLWIHGELIRRKSRLRIPICTLALRSLYLLHFTKHISVGQAVVGGNKHIRLLSIIEQNQLRRPLLIIF